MLVDGKLAGIGVRESVDDVARVLGRQVSTIVWRTYAQSDLEEMAAHAGVPVVNALTDEFHPCQLLADLLTVREHKGDAGRADRRPSSATAPTTWATPGCSPAPPRACTCGSAGPTGYRPDAAMFERGQRDRRAAPAARRPARADPVAAVAGRRRRRHRHLGLDGQGGRGGGARPRSSRRTRLTAELLAHAKPDAIVLHCLPAYRGKEIDAEVIDGPQSVVWDEAENRRHAQKAVLAFLAARRPS